MSEGHAQWRNYMYERAGPAAAGPDGSGPKNGEEKKECLISCFMAAEENVGLVHNLAS